MERAKVQSIIDGNLTRMAQHLIEMDDFSDEAIRRASEIFFPKGTWSPDNFRQSLMRRVHELQGA